MKVALTVWDGRISPLFDVCREAWILELCRCEVTSRTTVCLDAASATLKVQRLVDLGVTRLVCGAISEALREECLSQGISVCGFVAGEAEEIIAALLRGELLGSAFAMPGCCKRRHRVRARRGQPR